VASDMQVDPVALEESTPLADDAIQFKSKAWEVFSVICRGSQFSYALALLVLTASTIAKAKAFQSNPPYSFWFHSASFWIWLIYLALVLERDRLSSLLA
jgi:hypothetical protein